MTSRTRARRAARAAVLVTAGLSVATIASCDLNELLNEIGLVTLESELTGQNAFVHLQPDASAAAATDMGAVLEVMSWQDSEDSTVREGADPAALALAQRTARLRGAINADAFDLYDFSAFVPPGEQPKAIFDPVDLNALQTEYVIPNLNAIPIRNQGSRGTCAAFTAVGHLEYAVLQQNPSLGTVDLSEQFFYWLSKPECHGANCTSNDAGSWYGTGFDESIDNPGLEIPLERDCPYNSSQLSNEIQEPLASSCDNGAVSVERVELVYQPSEIIRVLEQDGLPVPFASPLSDNFFDNDGLITLADAGSAGDVFHAAGHAYLIVGYRKLPNMQSEGGMCFVIRNSWGAGWGVGGYSCITLAWMEEWNYGYALDQPIAVDIAVRADLDGGGGNDDLPPDWVDDETYDDETIDYDRLDDDDTVPDPEPTPNELTWSPAGLIGPDDRVYTFETAEQNGTWYGRGVVRGDGRVTGAVQLARQGNELVYDGDVVGRIEGSNVRVCTGEFDLLCALRFETTQNRLYVEFLYPEFRSVQPGELPDGAWETLSATGDGIGVEFRRADSVLEQALSPLYVRLNRTDGSATNPVRVTLGTNLDIRAAGTTIGSLSPGNFGLCNGNYNGRCTMFTGGQSLIVVPNW